MKFPLACFTLLIAGAGILIALDKANAALYVGVIALLSVIAAIIVLGVLAQRTTNGPLQEAYSRVMIALVAAVAGTGGGIGGSAVVSQKPTDKAEAAQETAQEAKTAATQAKREATRTRSSRPPARRRSRR